jgi:hypothetical protein
VEYAGFVFLKYFIMAKLGYTWYPKDWGNSESVFELNLSERGLYRELIDLAMMNDNKIEIKLDVWCRKFAIDLDTLNLILSKLSVLNLIEINGENLFIPSCESRLNLSRGGSKGGKKSKPTLKPISKPFESLEEKKEKPTSKQKKINIKEIEIPTYDLFLSYAKQQKPKVDESLVKLKYDSWVINEWKDGNGNKIVNWKSKLNNTLPYIAEKETKKFIPLKF